MTSKRTVGNNVSHTPMDTHWMIFFFPVLVLLTVDISVVNVNVCDLFSYDSLSFIPWDGADALAAL